MAKTIRKTAGKEAVLTHTARAGKRIAESMEQRKVRKDKALVKRMWNEELLA